MSKFVIGQPVKVVRVDDNVRTHLLGTESTITEVRLMKDGKTTVYGTAHAPIEPHQELVPVIGGILLRLGTLCWFEHELEPLIPPGLESAEEINELYEPEEVSA